MKKMFAIVLALLLCMTSFAIAETAPSITMGALPIIHEWITENEAGPDFWVKLLNQLQDTMAEDEYNAYLDILQVEIDKLAAAESVEAYFGPLTDDTGAEIKLTEKLGTDEVKVHEMHVVLAAGYAEEYGPVTARCLFATPYEENEQVVVMFGIVTANEDGTQSVAWKAYDGIASVASASVEEAGQIQVVLNPEMMLAIQNGTALLAVVSK